MSRNEFDQLMIDSYEGEGWAAAHGREGDTGRQKVKPERELDAARERLARAPKEASCHLRDLLKAADHLPRIPVSTSPPGVDGDDASVGYRDEDIMCAICGGNDEGEGNYIVLCDHAGCDRGYHQRCVHPPIPDAELEDPDAPYVCPFCQAVAEALERGNEHFGEDEDSVADLARVLDSRETKESEEDPPARKASVEEEDLEDGEECEGRGGGTLRRSKRRRQPVAQPVSLADLPPDSDSNDSSFGSEHASDAHSDGDDDEREEDGDEDESEVGEEEGDEEEGEEGGESFSPSSPTSPRSRRARRRKGRPVPDYVTMNMLLFGGGVGEETDDEAWSPRAARRGERPSPSPSLSPSLSPTAKRRRTDGDGT